MGLFDLFKGCDKNCKHGSNYDEKTKIKDCDKYENQKADGVPCPRYNDDNEYTQADDD